MMVEMALEVRTLMEGPKRRSGGETIPIISSWIRRFAFSCGGAYVTCGWEPVSGNAREEHRCISRVSAIPT